MTYNLTKNNIFNVNVFILFTEELKEHFVQYGEITNISLKTDPATGRSRGFAFIIFKSVDGLNNVRLKLKNFDI